MPKVLCFSGYSVIGHGFCPCNYYAPAIVARQHTQIARILTNIGTCSNVSSTHSSHLRNCGSKNRDKCPHICTGVSILRNRIDVFMYLTESRLLNPAFAVRYHIISSNSHILTMDQDNRMCREYMAIDDVFFRIRRLYESLEKDFSTSFSIKISISKSYDDFILQYGIKL